MPHPFLEVLGMIPAELRRRPGQIRIPDVVTARRYDLLCIGSPTWWLSTNVPIRSFLESAAARQALNGTEFAAAVPCRRYWRHNLKTVRKLGTHRGGVFADGIHFRYAGGQLRSLLALVSYLGSGEYRERFLRYNCDFAEEPPPSDTEVSGVGRGERNCVESRWTAPPKARRVEGRSPRPVRWAGY